MNKHCMNWGKYNNRHVIKHVTLLLIISIFINFLFALRHWREVHRLAGAWTGLQGAIQRLMVNGNTYQNLAANFTQHNTEIYDGLPCPSSENPCHNGGVCLPLLNSYLCKCASGYNGLHCEFCNY